MSQCGRGEDDKPHEVKRIKIELHDKRAALVDIGRHLDMFTAGDKSIAEMLIDDAGQELKQRYERLAVAKANNAADVVH